MWRSSHACFGFAGFCKQKKNALLMTVSMETVRVERSDLRLNLKATEIISLKNLKKKFASGSKPMTSPITVRF